jgi:hypothetical protein
LISSPAGCVSNHGFTVSGLANIHETAEMQAKAQLNADWAHASSHHQEEVQQWLMGLMPLAPREVRFIRKRFCVLRVRRLVVNRNPNRVPPHRRKGGDAPPVRGRYGAASMRSSFLTPRWRKTDSNPRSHLRSDIFAERYSAGIIRRGDS